MRRRDNVRIDSIGGIHPPSTGEHCPVTGWWIAAGSDRPRFVSEGEIMPSHDGKPSVWAIERSHALLLAGRLVAVVRTIDPAAPIVVEGQIEVQECENACSFCALPETD